MTGRMWQWSGGLAVVGVILLISDIHARATWTHPTNDASAVITLNQLLGFLVAAVFLIIAAMIMITGFRRHRRQQRYRRRSVG